MNLEFIDNYITNKINENQNYIVCTFYDLRIKHNLSEEETDDFLRLSKNKLENLGYRVYFTGAKFVYENASIIVQDNELMIAVKDII